MQRERMMPLAERCQPLSVLAHWRFDPGQVVSGSIEAGALVLADLSGSGNLLESVAVRQGPDAAAQEPEAEASLPLSWADGCGDKGGLVFRNDDAPFGCYFRTAADAPINRERFEQGYTIEAIVHLPRPFREEKHSWMGVLTRQGRGADIGRQGENELLATLSVSNCMEYQWVSHSSSRDMPATSWSRYLKEEEWHHVVIVNDADRTLLYVNGICDFNSGARNIIGIAAIEGKGWNVGASEWGGRLDKLFSGTIREIRIAGKPLDRADWLLEIEPKRVLEGTNDPCPLLERAENYQFAFVPDPQKLVYLNPEMFEAQTEWLAKHQARDRIAMTALLGDVVDHSEAEEEWERASRAVAILDDADVPYMMTAGNHDYDAAGTYLRHFGPERFLPKHYVRGCSPSGYSSYGIIEAGSHHYGWLMADMKHLRQDMAWCKEMLELHRTLPTVLVSHDILYAERDEAGRRTARDSENGTLIWNELVWPCPQVFMTVNGHFDGTAHRIRHNGKGQDVIQLLINYQDSYRGGNGWLRLAEFDERANRITFRTFSPWVDRLAGLNGAEKLAYPDYRLLTGSYDCFSIPLSFEERFAPGE